jgi:hypothetical protein
LSRRDTEEGDLLALLAPQFNFIDHLRQAQLSDLALIALSGDIIVGERQAPWSVVDGMVQFAGQLYIPLASPLVQEIMGAVHEDGHEGV